MNKKTAFLLLFLIVTMSLFINFLSLDKPNGFAFDEVYNIPTARDILNGIAPALPHPPLGFLIISSGKLIYPHDITGERMPSAVSGSICLIIVFFLAKKITRKYLTGIIAVFFLLCDPLWFVFSRIAMLDIFVSVFILASVYFAMEKKYFFSGIMFALAISVKWSALFIFPLFILLYFSEDIRKRSNFKKILIQFFSYILLPALVYYLIFAVSKDCFSIQSFVEQNILILKILKSINSNITYASPWWSWFVIPQYIPASAFYNDKFQIIKAVVFTENPQFLWFGIFSVFTLIYFSVKEKKLIYFIMPFCFIILIFPYIFAKRATYIYYILPMLPFLQICMAVLLTEIVEKKSQIRMILLCCFQCLIVFVFLYPALTMRGF